MLCLRRTYAKIYLDNLLFNAENYKKLLPPTTELMCVVKADAYGHGVKEIAAALQKRADVKWFAVSNIDEARELRECGITGEILILGYTPPEEADSLIQNDILQACLNEEYARELGSAATSGKVRVHIKLDTGMSRIGIDCSDIKNAADEAQRIYSADGISVEGLFTHLCTADSDDPDDIEFTHSQINKFNGVKNELISRGFDTGVCHFANSAAGVYGYAEGSDLARLGIILYGLYPNHALKVPMEMKPVLELFSTVAEVKTVRAGASIGYGRTFTADRDIRVATITVGYADGYPRLLSNRGEVLINGNRCPILGRVCMDQIMADVSGVDVTPGDEVVLIGKSKDQQITSDDIADLCDTIGYEVTCDITKRVPKLFIENGEVTAVE